MRNLIIAFIAIFLLGNAVSCSENDYDFSETSSENYIKPGIYSTDIILNSEKGNDNTTNTRGIDTINGQFTDEYPYDYIYIHPANNEKEDVLKIPLKDVEYCGDCRGIRLEIEVLEEDAGYIIKSEDGGSLKLSPNDSVYFSTIETPYWEALKQSASPISGRDVFVNSPTINSELLRSRNIYNLNELINLLETPQPSIEMSRHCTAFMISFMFSNVLADSGMFNLTPSEEEWKAALNGSTPDNFYIKLYIGPNFAHKYDLLNNKVIDETEGGFYATNNQTYTQFGLCYYQPATVPGQPTDPASFGGYGYESDYGSYLLSPLNTNIPASEFSIYAFVKYIEDPSKASEGDFLTSDEGSKWFEIPVPSMSLDPNRFHYIIMAFDYHDLNVFFQDATNVTSSTLTRGWFENRAPQEINIKPTKVKVITE